MTDARATWIVMGASGRIGAMLMRHWQAQPPRGLSFVPQRRQATGAGPELVWAPLQDGAAPLLDWQRAQGPIAGLLVFSGVTPAPVAALDLNVALAAAALDAARQAEIGACLIASSSAVYGAGRGVALTEDDPTTPANNYGHAKLAMEALCARADEQAVCCLRIGNVAGADMLLRNAAEATVQAPLQLDRFADGAGPRRSYIGPATLADCLADLALASLTLPPVLNLAAPSPVTMEQLLIAAGTPWYFTDAPAQALQSVTLDVTRLAALHAFGADASDPGAMVREWKTLAETI